MFLLIGADDNKLESSVAKRFGHAGYYLMYNTETNSFETYENIDVDHNHQSIREFLDKGVEAFIVGNVGPHAFGIINTPKSKVYLARKMSVKEAVEKFFKGELKQLDEPTVNKSIGHVHGATTKNIENIGENE